MNTTTNAAQFAANEILKANHISVAESIQMLLMYIVTHEDTDTFQAAVSHIREVLRLVCEATEPADAVL